jgi:signal transduction histidine kinase
LFPRPKRKTGLTEDLLALARGDSSEAAPPFESVDLGELAKEVVSEATANAKRRKIAVTAEADPNAPNVRANHSALRRVLLILLDNALKHTPRGVD